MTPHAAFPKNRRWLIAFAGILVVVSISVAAAGAQTTSESNRNIRLGGPIGPAGQAVLCDLPPKLRAKNVGGTDGAGLCVFTSVMHTARFQNTAALFDFQAKMKKHPGGGHPAKLAEFLQRYAPTVRYVQDTSADLDLLYRALKSGRMVSVTYAGRDPHYGPQTIAHMVNCLHLDPPTASPRWAAILDNNFVGEQELVWMPVAEFVERWKANHGGWQVILLTPPPIPVPRPE